MSHENILHNCRYKRKQRRKHSSGAKHQTVDTHSSGLVDLPATENLFFKPCSSCPMSTQGSSRSTSCWPLVNSSEFPPLSKADGDNAGPACWPDNGTGCDFRR